MTVLGAELARALQREAGLGVEAASRFVQTHTGQPFDEQATYSVGYPSGQTAAHWSKYDKLRIWKRDPASG
jgi:hypothetical protein